jgi:hypothetical protein
MTVLDPRHNLFPSMIVCKYTNGTDVLRMSRSHVNRIIHLAYLGFACVRAIPSFTIKQDRFHLNY